MTSLIFATDQIAVVILLLIIAYAVYLSDKTTLLLSEERTLRIDIRNELHLVKKAERLKGNILGDPGLSPSTLETHVFLASAAMTLKYEVLLGISKDYIRLYGDTDLAEWSLSYDNLALTRVRATQVFKTRSLKRDGDAET